MDAIIPPWYTPDHRSTVHAVACTAIRAPGKETRSDRESRRAEREAVCSILEGFKLISRTRSGVPTRDVEMQSFL